MNKNVKPAIVIAIAVMAMLALACVATTPASSPSATPTRGEPAAQVPTPLPTASDVVKMSAPAPIDRVDLLVSNGRATLDIMSGLPSGCAEFEAAEIVSESGGTIVARVTNLVPEPGQLIACTMIYGMHETSLDLSGNYDACQTYLAVINDEKHEVQASDPLVDCAPPAGFHEQEAPIDGVRIDAGTGLSGDGELVVTAGLPNACWEDAGYSNLLRKDDRISLNVINVRTAPIDAACAEIYRTVDHRIPLSDIQPCAVYDVIVNDTVHRVQAIAPNVRCAAPDPSKPAFKPVEAPIENVEIILGATGYVAIVTSGIPNGCDSFGGYDVHREGNEIRIRVYNESPTDPNLACILIHTSVETEIPLGEFVNPSDYVVIVNGARYPLTEPDGPMPKPLPAGTQIEAGIGETVSISSDTAIRFDAVVEDSRCPAHAICVWQGRAVVEVTVLSSPNGVESASLELDSGNPVTLGGYEILLAELNPYPGTVVLGPGMSPDYVAIFVVNPVSGRHGSTEPPAVEEAHMVLKAVPSQTEHRAFDLVAEIIGGANNNPALYCHGFEWDFGDGLGIAAMPGCVPYSPDIEIQREFTHTYSYTKSGRYDVSFTYGPLTASTVVNVP